MTRSTIIRVRGDNGLASPALLDYCEDARLGYAFGYATNPVLQRKSQHWLTEVELAHRLYGRRDPHMQRFESINDYQAESWPSPRRVVAKVEVTPQGSQRRFVVTNLDEPAREVYQGLYVRRGAVPEQPIGELKNGLSADAVRPAALEASLTAVAEVERERAALAQGEGADGIQVPAARALGAAVAEGRHSQRRRVGGRGRRLRLVGRQPRHPHLAGQQHLRRRRVRSG